MAVGDVVAGISVNATLTFQPASGVEIMLVWSCGSGYQGEIYDGTNFQALGEATTGISIGVGGITAPSGAGQPMATLTNKLFINNSIYIRIRKIAATNNAAYSGIQIK